MKFKDRINEWKITAWLALPTEKAVVSVREVLIEEK